MQPTSSILVATDLSARCDRAVDRAAALAVDWEGRLRVIHVVDDRDTRDQSKLEKAVRATLRDPTADIDILLPHGSAPETIARCAEETASAIIVTGIARYNHFGDYFLGTAVEYVLRHAAAPVLVVKQRPRHGYRTMLVPTDFSDHSHAALLTAANLFPDAIIHLVHAYQVPFEGRLDTPPNRTEIERAVQADLDGYLGNSAFLPELRARVHGRLGYGERHIVIGEAIQDIDPDIVVLASRRRSALGHALLGSSAHTLLSSIATDTLVIKV
ncbi:universal stress protein [Mesorhizobium sp. LHD-90]|uniref:universal stress protein n=1 Tax=Mesorhizobium sp. LHD-90 TaxID=3071414 RepID=UPI0027E1B72A|nr:universal stress protein [Mesorhizobium sp. LHD-90]MDQ6433075.1 universal stress protein [Mesorhizobium sp. LHD-90]